MTQEILEEDLKQLINFKIMAKFVKLMRVDGKDVYVNVNHIVHFFEIARGEVKIVTEDTYLIVAATNEELIKLLSQ